MNTTGEHEHCLAPGCARPLYSKASRARGFGWGCWRRIRAAARIEALAAKLAAFTARQVESAREAIEDAAVIPAAVIGWFSVVSSDGTAIYEATAESCPVPRERGVLAPGRGHHGERLMTAAARPLTFDDALAAAEALAEIDAGHENAAGAILGAARLDALSNGELEALCRRFGTGP